MIWGDTSYLGILTLRVGVQASFKNPLPASFFTWSRVYDNCRRGITKGGALYIPGI